MPRQRNDTGSVLVAFDLDGEARNIGPGDEFDCSLPVPGCTPVDPPGARVPPVIRPSVPATKVHDDPETGDPR
jgi:hypothetical protein